MEGTFYSYGHKDSVNSVTQKMKDDAPAYKVNSEIDIMLIIQVLPIYLYSKIMLPQKKMCWDLFG